MKKYAKIIYGMSVVLITVLLVIFYFYPQIDKTMRRADSTYDIITDYEFRTYENDEAPIGITQEYRFTLENVPLYNGCVHFNLVHQEADVYLGDELVYQLKAADNAFISRTPGYDWVDIYLTAADEGKELRIYVQPVYKSSLSNQLDISFGDMNAIRKHVMLENLPAIEISVLAIIIGLAFIGFTFINIRSKELDRSIFMLGIFSIVVGLWKLCDMTIAPLIFSNPLVLSTIALAAITMMIFPFLTFIQRQLNKENNRVWNIVSILCSTAAFTIMLLQVCGIADLRETLTCAHIGIAGIILFVIANVIQEARNKTFSNRLKLTVGCCVLCLVGVVIDMTVYYYSGHSGNMIFCLSSFLIYAVLMGLMAARDTKRLIDQGRKAEHYQTLAFRDTLTGLYNRAFYYEFLKTNDVYRENCFLIMMDVNDLKPCNDKMGHDFGDALLTNSAKLITDAFPTGECMRMGGDEFCVILPESNETECKVCLKIFDKLVKDFNANHPDVYPVSIAYGYASYDTSLDLDFSDTLRRADKMMYQMKLDMKGYVR